MKGRRWLILVMLVVGSIIGCGGRDNRTQATDMCKDGLREAMTPGRWEDADRTGVRLSVAAIHAISPENMWEVNFDELPVSQSGTMETGIGWAAAIEIIHALQVTYHDGEEPVWIDARALCAAKADKGKIYVECSYWPLYR